MPVYSPALVHSKLLSVTSNTTAVIPAGYSILQIVIENTTANAITGGLRVGTTDGGADVVVALAVGANQLQVIPDAATLKQIFSMSVDTTLYIQAVTLWNSANLNLTFVLRRIS